MRLHRSIAGRLSLMFALAAFGSFALIGLTLHQLLGRELIRYQHDQVQSRLDDVGYMLGHAHLGEVAERAKEKMAQLSSVDGRVRYWMWSEDPAYRFGDDAQQVAASVLGRRGVTELSGSDGRQRAALGVVLPPNDQRPAVQLVVGVDARSFSRTLRIFEWGLAGLSALGAVLIAALGYAIARTGLRPVERLSQDAHRLGPHSPVERLELGRLPQELIDFGASFNAALDRLNTAYRQLESFNADVAHELRTPVANLIGQTQVALARERDAAALREVLQSNLEELERLRGIVADMLFLARAEQGERAQRLATVSLAQEVHKTIEFFEMVLEDAGMHIALSGDATVRAEVSLLRRALSNLLQNAIQHAQSSPAIEVRIDAVAPDRVELSVKNGSAALSDAQLAHLFDRFYRVDRARSNSGESHGLGLSIVKAIATMHDGEVFARQEGGSIVIGLRIPVAPQEGEAHLHVG